MRVDNAGPRTWLLAMLAGWALLVWGLALFGMGGQIDRLRDDASLARQLPTPRPPPPERVGPLAQYGETGARPLFTEDRRPQPFSLQPEGEGTQVPSFEFVLTSVLQTPTLQMAIVQPSAGGESIRMKLGEAPEEAQGWRLVELHPRSAVFQGPEGPKSLELRTFDGTGGEAPTAMAAQPPAGTTAPARTIPKTPPATTAKPATTPTPAAPAPTGTAAMTPEAQMEAIRKRIEARRAQLRAQAQQQQPPPNKP